MDHKSFLDLIQEEHQICKRIQDVSNILRGTEGAVADGLTEEEKRIPLLDQLYAEREQLMDKLQPVRVEIGGRVMGYQGLAERVILANLYAVDKGEEDI